MIHEEKNLGAEAWARGLIITTICVAINACGVGPKLGPFDAHAPLGLRDRTANYSAALLPVVAVAGAWQLSDLWDVGLAQEGIVTNSWVKYRVLDNKQGLAIAGTAGAFRGDSNYKAKGAHAGLIVSYRHNPWTLSLAARTHRMSYVPAAIDDPFNGHLAFPKLTTDGLESYHSVDLIISLRPSFGMTFRAGVRCSDDRQSGFIVGVGYDVDFGCLPLIAVSL